MPAASAACMTMLPSATLIFLPSSSISTMVVVASGSGQLGSHGRALRARADQAVLVLDVVRELVAEVLEHAAHRHRGSVTQCADGAAHDVLGHRIEQLQIFHAALALLDAMHDAPQPAGALAARRALPARLVHVEIR